MSASKELKVGIFVLASVSLVLGGVIALGSGTLFKETAIIETSTKVSVNGLQVGSPVKYRGVPVGEVSAIAFADRYYDGTGTGGEAFDFDSEVVIRMKVRLDVFGPEQTDLFTKDIERGVASGLRARLASAGLTGGLFIDLDLDRAGAVAAQAPPYTPDYPYIPNAPTKFDQMIDHVGIIARKLSEVDYVTIGAKLEKTIADVNSIVADKVDPMLGEAKDFISELRASNAEISRLLKSEEITSTLGNIEAITADMRGIVGDGSPDLKAGIAEFPRLMKRASDAAERLDEILKSRRIDEILASLEKTSGELPPTVAEYRAVGQQLQQFLASESHEIRQLIEALRATAENLEQVTGSARNDLGQTIFGAPPPRVAPGQPVPGGAR